MDNNTKYNWPDLSKDAKAIELAKVAIGWDELTIEQRIARHRELVVKAEEFKGAL